MSFTLRLLCPRERAPGNSRIWGWMCPGTRCRRGKYPSCWVSNPCRTDWGIFNSVDVSSLKESCSRNTPFKTLRGGGPALFGTSPNGYS